MAPASSTPVAPPPTITKVSHAARRAASLSRSARSKESRMRRRIEVASSSVFKPGRVRLPLVVAEIGVTRAGREHERVVADLARRPRAAPRARSASTPDDRAEQRGDVLALAKELTDRPGDFRGGERCRPDLVEQRLKQMVVALIDDGDANARALQSLCDGESAEAAADDHHMMRGEPALTPSEPPAVRRRRRSPPRSRHRDRRITAEPP